MFISYIVCNIWVDHIFFIISLFPSANWISKKSMYFDFFVIVRYIYNKLKVQSTQKIENSFFLDYLSNLFLWSYPVWKVKDLFISKCEVDKLQWVGGIKRSIDSLNNLLKVMPQQIWKKCNILVPKLTRWCKLTSPISMQESC